jgi:hypothetical protein
MADKESAGIGKGTPGPGRGKGTLNKSTASAKEAFTLAFKGLGGYEALTKWARDNETEFFKLYARLIPAEVHGVDGGPLSVVVQIVREGRKVTSG